MATFPAYAKLGFEGFSQKRESALSRTSMESGPPKHLKVKSRVLVERPVMYFFDTLADFDNFITWFQSTVNYGADWFDWTDPKGSVVRSARIKSGTLEEEKPRRKNLDRWVVRFVLETWSG
jgi:hypothetical protein